MASGSSHPGASPVRATSDFDSQDHRKRRRNRMRASCLNCYASKRKCDKKRPCTRCVRLGTTNLCVYEQEEHTNFDHNQTDEIQRLRRRIIELETTVVGLRHRNNLSWSAQDGVPRPHESSTFRLALHTNPLAKDTSNAEGARLNDAESRSQPRLEGCALPPPMNPSLLRGYDCATPYPYSSPTLSERSEDVFPPSCGPQESSFGCEAVPTSPVPPYSPSVVESIDYQYSCERQACNCVTLQEAFVPLVNLGLSLRTCRESLMAHHVASNSHCSLFSRIAGLEEDIYSMAPRELPVRNAGYDRQASLQSQVHPSEAEHGVSSVMDSPIPYMPSASIYGFR